MTPIKDYAFWSRQRLIKDKRSAKQMHFQELIAKGLSEVDAANMSGWHPMVNMDAFFKKLAWTLIVVGLGGLLVLYASTTAANMENKDRVVSAANMEEAFTRCLNGEQIALSDGTTWFCLRGSK
jgi:hypothetical protein